MGNELVPTYDRPLVSEKTKIALDSDATLGPNIASIGLSDGKAL